MGLPAQVGRYLFALGSWIPYDTLEDFVASFNEREHGRWRLEWQEQDSHMLPALRLVNARSGCAYEYSLMVDDRDGDPLYALLTSGPVA